MRPHSRMLRPPSRRWFNSARHRETCMQFDLKGPRFPYTCRHTGNYVKTCEDVVLARRADWNLFQLGPVAQQRRPKFFFHSGETTSLCCGGAPDDSTLTGEVPTGDPCTANRLASPVAPWRCVYPSGANQSTRAAQPWPWPTPPT